MKDYRQAMEILIASKVHFPALVKEGGEYRIYERMRRICEGRTIDEALEKGGFPDRLPDHPFFVEGPKVFHMKTGEVCTARSNSYALRIANALNFYIPGKRGF
jgi:hypothetical protein